MGSLPTPEAHGLARGVGRRGPEAARRRSPRTVPVLGASVRSLPGASGCRRGGLRTSGPQRCVAAPRWLPAGGVGGAGGAGLVPACASPSRGRCWTRTEPPRAQGLHFCRIPSTCTRASSRSRREVCTSPRWGWEEGPSPAGAGGVAPWGLVQARAGASPLADRRSPGTGARSGSYENVTLPLTRRGLVRRRRPADKVWSGGSWWQTLRCQTV